MAKKSTRSAIKKEWNLPGFVWRYKHIERGSDSLKAVFAIITGGIPPGYKEEKKHEHQ